MEIDTITDDARRSIISLYNDSVVIEYEFIINYPRIIDHIVNFEKLKMSPS